MQRAPSESRGASASYGERPLRARFIDAMSLTDSHREPAKETTSFPAVSSADAGARAVEGDARRSQSRKNTALDPALSWFGVEKGRATFPTSWRPRWSNDAGIIAMCARS